MPRQSGGLAGDRIKTIHWSSSILFRLIFLVFSRNNGLLFQREVDALKWYSSAMDKTRRKFSVFRFFQNHWWT